MLATDLKKTQSYKYNGKDIGKYIEMKTTTTSTCCYETGRVRSVTSVVYTFEKMTIHGDDELTLLKTE